MGTDGDQIRVLVVDDDALVRSGLRLMLGGATGLKVVGEVSDGADAPAAIREHRPDVVLMDIRMPVVDGLTATAQIMARPAPPAIIVLTTFDADDLVLGALRAGASGFLLKDTPPALIVEAIHRVHAGDPMLSPAVTQRLIRAVVTTHPDPRHTEAVTLVDSLTPRERDIALAIAEGKTNADIAAEQFVSVATVKSHVTHLLTKLHAANRVQIAIRIHDAGLV
ncbi:MAG: response regulator transcription factor [Dermatophilaceae bacterium]